MTKEIPDLSTFLEEMDKDMKIWERIYYFFVRNWDRADRRLRNIKFFWQRGKKGYSDLDVWGFDAYLCKVMVGGLTKLIDNLHGHPYEFGDTHPDDPLAAWSAVLKEMREGFEAAHKIIDPHSVDDDYEVMANYKELEDKFNRGMDLFKKYFFDLWD